jgi:hypothetical protein
MLSPATTRCRNGQQRVRRRPRNAGAGEAERLPADNMGCANSPTFATRPEIQLISPASLIQAIDFVGHGFGKARVVKTCCIEFSVVFVTLPACFYEPQNASRTERNIAIGT